MVPGAEARQTVRDYRCTSQHPVLALEAHRHTFSRLSATMRQQCGLLASRGLRRSCQARNGRVPLCEKESLAASWLATQTAHKARYREKKLSVIGLASALATHTAEEPRQVRQKAAASQGRPEATTPLLRDGLVLIQDVRRHVVPELSWLSQRERIT